MSGLLIAVVGVCASGKSTLVRGLQARGWNARHVVQEHSYVPDMWQRVTRPDLLICLDASLETIRQRRCDPEMPAWLIESERYRLRHALAYCDLYIKTDALTADQVLERALDFLGVMEDRAQ
jgi:deoxyadenosine/deoxycytidine kinase